VRATKRERIRARVPATPFKAKVIRDAGVNGVTHTPTTFGDANSRADRHPNMKVIVVTTSGMKTKTIPTNSDNGYPFANA